MRQETIAIYKINELSEDAQENAHNDYLNNGYEYFHADDNAASLNAFADMFGLRIKDFDYGYRSYVSFSVNETNIEELIGNRLHKWLVNNIEQRIVKDCPLTGMCIDESLLDDIRAFIKKPNLGMDCRDLMNDCLYNWVYACRDDFEYTQSFEYFVEESQFNEWEYTEDGDLH